MCIGISISDAEAVLGGGEAQRTAAAHARAHQVRERAAAGMDSTGT